MEGKLKEAEKTIKVSRMSINQDFEITANLCFVFKKDRVLLIKKKRGLGEGLYNAPGGKVEPGESSRQATKREVKEETRLEINQLEKAGDLKFYFGEKPFMDVDVFKTTDYTGEIEETEEARPEWFETENIPFDNMWPDDKYWIPLLLEDKSFEGVFYFDEDGDKIQDHELKETSI